MKKKNSSHNLASNSYCVHHFRWHTNHIKCETTKMWKQSTQNRAVCLLIKRECEKFFASIFFLLFLLLCNVTTYPSNKFFAQDLQSGNHFIKFALLFVDASICGGCSCNKRSCNIGHLTVWYSIWHHVFTAIKQNEMKSNESFSAFGTRSMGHRQKKNNNKKQNKIKIVCHVPIFFLGGIKSSSSTKIKYVSRKMTKFALLFILSEAA